MKRMSATLLLLSAVTVPSVSAGDRLLGREFATRSPVIARNGMVATAHPFASAIGVEILEKGGSAVDAAIAVNAALGLMEPTGCGIGGDLFAIVWDAKTQKLYGLNGSGRSAAALTLEDLRAKGITRIPPNGGLPVTVPGTVDAWFEMHKKFGRLPVSTLLAPAIRYAREGHPLQPVIALYWERNLVRFAEFAEFQATYAPGGNIPKAGDVVRNPDLAATYEAIARGGRDAFYKGPIAKSIADAVQKYGGALTVDDLAAHRSEWVEPVSTNYRGYDVWELGPNTQGIAALQMLNMLEPFDLRAMGHNTTEALHAMVEIKKIVYEDRAKYYADPTFYRAPVAALISKQYAKKRLALFDPATVLKAIPAGDADLRTGDTTYFTVVDKDRNAVSLIQSNFRGSGSGVVPAGRGFTLQDRGELFSLDPNHANVYAPRKRPFHTIIPAMVTKGGRPVFSFGVMGGDVQPQGHVQVLVNIIDHGMDVQEAGDAPRFDHEGSSEPTDEVMTEGGTLHLESGVPPSVVRGLTLKGHTITETFGTFGGYQGIWIDWDRGVLLGATESRKDGIAMGY